MAHHSSHGCLYVMLSKFVKHDDSAQNAGQTARGVSATMQAMARTRDVDNEVVCKNLRAFRAAAGMSQDEASSASNVSIDNLRRYESGTVTAPAAALLRLGEIYGHAMEDFFSDHPPAAKLDERPVLFLRSLPGVEVDREFLDKAHKVIAQVNAEFRERKKTAKKR